MTSGADTKAAARALLNLNRAAPRAARSFQPPLSSPLGKLSDEQERILANASHRLVITALAGTGKSRVLAEFARREPQRKWHYLAFNKSMAHDASKTMPSVVAKTVHALAYGAFGGPYQEKLATRVDFDIVLAESGAPKSGGRLLAIVIVATVQRFIASSDHAIQSHHVPLAPWMEWRAASHETVDLVDVVAFATTWWSSMVQHAGIAPMDLDGLVKLMQLANHVPLAPKNSAFLVDEAQDLTPCVRSWLDQLPYRVVRAGDPFQSIYGWRMQGLSRAWVGDDEKEAWLTGSWRFGPEVASLVNPLLSHLGSRHGLVGLAPGTEIGCTPRGDEALLSRTRSRLREEIVTAWANGKAVDPQWAPWLVSVQPDEDILAVEDARPMDFPVKRFERGGLLAMTAHASKGGSFDAVRVLSDFSWPIDGARGDEMEEARVLYVALTRAKRRLVLDDALLHSLRRLTPADALDLADGGF